MMEDGCAFVCAIMLLIGSVLSGFVLMTGNWEPMVIVVVFAVITLFLATSALASHYM